MARKKTASVEAEKTASVEAETVSVELLCSYGDKKPYETIELKKDEAEMLIKNSFARNVKEKKSK